MEEKIEKAIHKHSNGTKEVYALHIAGEQVPTLNGMMSETTRLSHYFDRVDTIAKVAIVLSSISIVLSLVLLKILVL